MSTQTAQAELGPSSVATEDPSKTSIASSGLKTTSNASSNSDHGNAAVPERKTLMLLDMPADSSADSIKSIFPADIPVTDVAQEIDHIWYVTFESKDKAVAALKFVSSQKNSEGKNVYNARFKTTSSYAMGVPSSAPVQPSYPSNPYYAQPSFMPGYWDQGLQNTDYYGQGGRGRSANHSQVRSTLYHNSSSYQGHSNTNSTGVSHNGQHARQGGYQKPKNPRYNSQQTHGGNQTSTTHSGTSTQEHGQNYNSAQHSSQQTSNNAAQLSNPQSNHQPSQHHHQSHHHQHHQQSSQHQQQQHGQSQLHSSTDSAGQNTSHSPQNSNRRQPGTQASRHANNTTATGNSSAGGNNRRHNNPGRGQNRTNQASAGSTSPSNKESVSHSKSNPAASLTLTNFPPLGPPSGSPHPPVKQYSRETIVSVISKFDAASITKPTFETSEAPILTAQPNIELEINKPLPVGAKLDVLATDKRSRSLSKNREQPTAPTPFAVVAAAAARNPTTPATTSSAGANAAAPTAQSHSASTASTTKKVTSTLANSSKQHHKEHESSNGRKESKESHHHKGAKHTASTQNSNAHHSNSSSHQQKTGSNSSTASTTKAPTGPTWAHIAKSPADPKKIAAAAEKVKEEEKKHEKATSQKPESEKDKVNANSNQIESQQQAIIQDAKTSPSPVSVVAAETPAVATASQ